MTLDSTRSAGTSSDDAGVGSGRATRDRILDAAETLFAVRGLAGTSVRDIATAVDLNPASLYNHFTSKHALYEAVLERGIRPLAALLEEAAADDDTDPTRIIDDVMNHLAKTPQLPRLIHHEALTGGEHLSEIVRNVLRPLVTPAMAAAQRNADEAGWESDEIAPLIAAWLHMVFGHFAMAPLLKELFGEDPLTDDNIARQTRFLRKTSYRLMGRDDPE